MSWKTLLPLLLVGCLLAGAIGYALAGWLTATS